MPSDWPSPSSSHSELGRGVKKGVLYSEVSTVTVCASEGVLISEVSSIQGFGLEGLPPYTE